MARRTVNLLENARIDLDISPDLENLMRNNAEIAPKAQKLGFRRITKEGSKKIKAAIRSAGLVRSGELAKSVRGSTTNKKSVIGTKTFYAPFLEDGTKSHRIAPRKSRGKGKFLRIPVEGRSVFTKSVTHPGVQASHFFEGTFNQMESSGQVSSLFAMGVQEAIEAVQNGSS
jgi:HK97 gp10 family phage protein